MKDFILANGNFAVELFKLQLKEKPGKNCISFSIGVEMALGMLLLGSGETTADQIRKISALHFWRWPETVTPTGGLHSGTECDKPGRFHSWLKQLLSTINQHSKHHTLKIANRLHGSNTHDFLEQYKQCVKELYNLDFERVDFMNASEEARQKINSWVERQTMDQSIYVDMMT
ncbi:serpin B3-like [Pituophis catenifer annectens]|uniref:serpin B3-like n=1 Tax=Pituophis catenifer annectens TaxID=94852 RepID=UPI0039948827